VAEWSNSRGIAGKATSAMGPRVGSKPTASSIDTGVGHCVPVDSSGDFAATILIVNDAGRA
jgi:hypothetical protein